MIRLAFFISALGFLISSCQSNKSDQVSNLVIDFPQDYKFKDGRLLLMISTSNETEPRIQIRDNPTTAQVFGMNVENHEEGSSINFNLEAYGYPVPSLSDVHDGSYLVKALFHKYKT